MNLTMLNLQEILSILVFGSILFVWVVRYSNIKDEFKSFNLPKWLRDLVGILKLSFAIMLLNDNLELSALVPWASLFSWLLPSSPISA